MDKLFLIGIGGTGMRCLEAFTHLSAIGLFDSHEVDILTLDTDQTNGNKKRAEELIQRYIRIKSAGSVGDGGKANSKTFFSAKLRLSRFFCNYNSGRNNFRILSQINSVSEENQQLSDLFFDEGVQHFDLNHGYRAQTHLGAHLMYHAIIEAARNVSRGNAEPHEVDFMAFVERVQKAGKDARVFIFGSIFGGTGASSIPIIPKALKDAIEIRSGGKSSIEAKFGATLLSEYFSFNKPNGEQLKKKGNEVIADSSFFTLNSQAALQFYQNDPTVRKTYKFLYHIGWPMGICEYNKANSGDETITGGEKQMNPCHITEMLCGFAAYDFFHRTDGFEQKEVQYVFRSAEYTNNALNFNFEDFIGKKDAEKFKNRLAAFYTFAMLTLISHKGAHGQNGVQNLIESLSKNGVKEFDGQISADEAKEIGDYLKNFAFWYDNGNLVPGWLYQIKNTVPGHFLFPAESFGTGVKETEKINYGRLFKDDAHNWAGKGSFLKAPDPFQDLTGVFIKDESVRYREEQNVDSAKSKLLAQLYNTITKLQKIEQ